MVHSFIKAALVGSNSFGKYLLGIICIGFTAMIIGGIPAFIVFGYSDNPEAATEMNFEAAGISPALGLTLMLMPFVFGLLAALFTVKWIHERPWRTLITPNKHINWKKVGVGALIWLILLTAFELEAYRANPDNYVWTFEAAQFFPVLIVTLLLIPLQTTFEEVLFRGYFMQGLGIGLRYPIIALVFTSVVFGALHLGNPEISEYGTWLIWSYIQIGLMFGLVTLLDEGLELALGVHAMNNIYASVIVTFPGSALEMPALFTMQEMDAEMMYLYSTIAEILFILICAYIYKWGNWRKLFQQVSTLKSKTTAESVIESENWLEE
ncbi:MAG: lysostaphin resistance A-like protein [Saprospiraceae bacterium]